MIKKIKRFFSKIYFAVGWTVIIFILLALPGSMIPHEEGFSIPQFDKFVHICLFGGFVLLWGIYYESKKLPQKKLLRLFFIVFIIACLYGTGMEYVQKYFIPMRDFDTWDIIADLVGAGLAYGICNMGLTGIE
jgi:VanZ family protein